MIGTEELRSEFGREIEHWKTALDRLADPDDVAPAHVWSSLEHYLGVTLRQSLGSMVARAREMTDRFERDLLSATVVDADVFQPRLVAARQAYTRAETAVVYYGDALVTRSIPHLGALLRACDHLATRSIAEILTPLGRQVPAVLSYLDKGFGASILKAGLRLWDGTAENPIAALKVTRHNLLRPSAIFHEGGHQVAHQLGWNEELAAALRSELGGTLGEIWSAFASEMSADAIAHVHSGYAAAVALHDVLDGADQAVFSYFGGDPHPPSMLRVLLACQCCVRTFGPGPWNKLAEAWTAKHRIERAPADIRQFMEMSVRAMPQIAEILLYRPYRAFGNRPLTAIVDPMRVSPAALLQLDRDAGSTGVTSPYWWWNESIRLTALNGYRAGMGPAEMRRGVAQQREWMLRLGALSIAA
jgi:hypothetical protein